MFPQFKKRNNESGIVLFVVLMSAIIIMIISVGILTQSMNEINYAQQQIDQIISDQLAKGVFWNAYSNAVDSGSVPSDGLTSNMQGRMYQVSMNPTASMNAAVSSYNVTANYDTFQ